MEEGKVVPLPQAGNNYEPKTWRGVIMYIINIIYNSIMCEQLFKIISKHGVKCQFGSAPGFECQDSKFAIKHLYI